MTPPRHLLVTFAVPAEARPFRVRARSLPGVRVVVTGMGGPNAGRAVTRALAEGRPDGLITSGFAGGLNPRLAVGQVIWEGDPGGELGLRLQTVLGAPCQFVCVDRVAVTVAEKAALRSRSGADAVEMESGVIRAQCRQAGIPSATVRVISDAAGEAMPVDFNRVLTRSYRLDPVRLMGVLAGSPRTVLALIRFQRQLRTAAEGLARVLAEVIRG